MQNFCVQRLKHADTQQTKYYNRKHKPISYTIDNLILLFTKNFKQKRFNKKLSHKFVDPFKIEDKIKAQIYRLTLSNIY